MSKNDWLADDRHMLAAGRILDAASTLFAAEGNVDGVGTQEISAAAGCSRTTFYRYFPTREDLLIAYAHRETRRVIDEVAQRVASIADPRERLIEAILCALTIVRQNPALAAWYAKRAPIGGQIADGSDVVTSIIAAHLPLHPASAASDDVNARARWVVRSINSLLQFPETDSAERYIAQHFIAPVVLADLSPAPQSPANRAGAP